MADLFRRLAKYVPVSHSSNNEADCKVMASSVPDATGVIMWNLIVKEALLIDELWDIWKHELTDAAHDLADYNDSGSTSLQVVQMVAKRVTKLSITFLGDVKLKGDLRQKDYDTNWNETVEKLQSSVIKALPKLIEFSATRMDHGAFIESTLVAIAMALAHNESSLHQQHIGYKIWRFILKTSVSAARRHGKFFGVLMTGFLERHFSRSFTEGCQAGQESSKVAFKTLIDVFCAIQVMAVQDVPSFPFRDVYCSSYDVSKFKEQHPDRSYFFRLYKRILHSVRADDDCQVSREAWLSIINIVFNHNSAISEICLFDGFTQLLMQIRTGLQFGQCRRKPWMPIQDHADDFIQNSFDILYSRLPIHQEGTNTRESELFQNMWDILDLARYFVALDDRARVAKVTDRLWLLFHMAQDDPVFNKHHLFVTLREVYLPFLYAIST